MSKKTVSLQEFFRTNGPPGTYNNNLPVRPRRDSDDDQGLHLRLAQSCTLDSGKAYPQRYGPSGKEGRFAEHGSYGSSDGTPVGDVDYYRPHGSGGPYHHSSGSDSYYARRQGVPPRGLTTYDRPGQHGYEPPSAYRAPAGMPPAGGPHNAAPMGPPLHPGTTYGSYSAGPGYGHPPPAAYGAPGRYGAPPQHPPSAAYGAPPDAAARAPVTREGSGGLLQGAGPIGSGYAGCVPPLMGHPMPGGGAGYGAPPPLYGAPPPPPPPPRQAPPQQVQGERQPVAAHVPASAGVSVAYNNRPAATAPVVGGVSAGRAEALASAPGLRAAAPAAQPAGSIAPHAAAVRKTTPFAAAKPEPAAEEPAAPAAPKNEFAERLAQRAMASAARAKSSLLAGGGSAALSTADSLGSAGSTQVVPGGKPPSRGMSVDIPGAGVASGTDSSTSSPTDAVLVKPPSASVGRPKLMLKPRSVPIQDASWRSGNYSSTSSDSGDAPVDIGSGSAASSLTGGRPRLHLLPRGSSLGDSNSGGGAAGARKPSVFGNAKPREEVLKERGLDPALVDAAADLGLTRRQVDGSTARMGSAGDRGNNGLASRGSAGADDDEWHTVSGHGRKGSSAQRGDSVLVDGGFDPFFGSGSVKPASRSEYVSAPFNRDGYDGRRSGVYGSPSKYGGDDDEGGVFRRALPTRQVPLAL